MGLFSKEACCFCGKEVGMMGRAKLADKNYICDECKYLMHPFIRADKVNKEGAQQLMQEMEAHEAHFQETTWRKTSRVYGRDEWTFYDSFETGEFALDTPETKRYKYHYVFDMNLVRPYDYKYDGSQMPMPALSKQEVKDSITFTAKESGGSPDGFVMHIPYFHKDMNIDIHFPGRGLKEDDARYVYEHSREIIANFVSRSREIAVKQNEMQGINMAKTANAALGALLTGKGKEGAMEELQKGAQMSQDIADGKVKKGLFGRLKKKD